LDFNWFSYIYSDSISYISTFLSAITTTIAAADLSTYYTPFFAAVFAA
jgi:hypothetical protein